MAKPATLSIRPGLMSRSGQRSITRLPTDLALTRVGTIGLSSALYAPRVAAFEPRLTAAVGISCPTA